MNLGKYKGQLRISRTCHTQSTMPRKESPLWNKYCVNRQARKSSGNYYWYCRLCGFHGSGTLTRLVAHHDGIKGEGIDKCVQEAMTVAQESELTCKKIKRIKEVEAMEQQIELQEGIVDTMVDSMF